MARPPRKGRRGPKLPFARIERAVELRMLGHTWAQITRLTGTPRGTLLRWQADPEVGWRDMEQDWLEQDPLVRRAKAVLAKALMVQLDKKNPDTALAERLLTPRSNGDGDYPRAPGGGGRPNRIVELPVMDEGLESKPASQVLMPPPPPPPAAPAPAPKGKKPVKPPPRVTKRTILGPDE